MAIPIRFTVVTLLTATLLVSVGCATMSPAGDPVAEYDQSRQLDRQWTQQRESARATGNRIASSDSAGQAAGGSPAQPASFDEKNQQQEESWLGLDLLTPSKLPDTFKRITGNTPDREIARSHFQEAETIYQQAVGLEGKDRRGKFVEAAALYKKAAARWPDSALQEDALFKVGECQFFADRYAESEDVFAELIEKYPNSRYLDVVDARRFAIARYWLAVHKENPKRLWQPNFLDSKRPRFDTFGHAVRLFDRIRLDDPAGKLSDDATMAAANAFFEAGKYRKADVLYTDLRETFPSSEHQYQAHLLGLKCKLLIYQGPDYSDIPLDEAEKLVKQIRQQFRHEHENDRKYIDRAYAEVRARMAEIDWYLASFYHRRGETSGARHYYERLARSYPNTKAAEAAREQLAQLGVPGDAGNGGQSWMASLFNPPQRELRLTEAANEEMVQR